MTSSQGDLYAEILALFQSGQTDRARALCQLYLAQTDDAPAWNLAGVLAGTAGDKQEAERCFREALKRDPASVKAATNLGHALKALGRLEDAVTAFRAALAREDSPGLRVTLSEALIEIGLIRLAGKDYTAARTLFETVTVEQPDSAAAWQNLGYALWGLGELDAAAAALERAIAAGADPAGIWNDIGRIRSQQGRHRDAAGCFERAFELNPEIAIGCELARCRCLEGRPDLALQVCDGILAANPDPPVEAWFYRGLALQGMDRAEEAEESYRRATTLKPDYAAAFYNLGNLLRQGKRSGEAEACYRRALAIRPDYPSALISLGAVVEEACRMDEAERLYRRALALRPDDALRIRLATLMPAIMESHEAIEFWRARLEREVRSLLGERLSVTNPEARFTANFYLAYHGLNNRELQTLIARLHLQACPSLGWTAPPCRERTPRRPGPIRIGFISSYLRNHSIGRITRGQIAMLSRDRFRVHALFVAPLVDDEISRFIRERADETVLLPPTLQAARERIAALELDILFYQDIGMDPFTYFLAFARLAPVQCVFFGHPDTTGIPNMDWWVSSDGFEPEDARGHYSEKLFLLRDLATPTYYYRPTIPPTLKSRAHFGLPEDAHVYLCPQTLFKVHPDFDPVLAGILRTDPKAVVAFIQPWNRHWMEVLQRRFRRTLGEVAGRVQFVPAQSAEPDYLNLLAVADVNLDTPHFNGMNTSLESFAVGVPVVTWPRHLQRGRHTAAMYRKMGIADCIAADAQGYVDIAVRLGTEPDFRSAVREQILARNHVLYENMDVIREFERFFEQAINLT